MKMFYLSVKKRMKILVAFPSIVEKYSSFFKSCFSNEGFLHFKKAISGFLLNENKTLTAINEMFIFDVRHQSTFNRFFNQQHFDLSKVNAARLEMLQSHPATRLKAGRSGGGVISIDNSLLKHYGKHFDNIHYHFDYVHKCYRWSHDLVSLYYSDDQTDYPISWKLWLPPDWEAVAEFFNRKDFKINEDKWNNRHAKPQAWRNYIRSRYRAGRQKYPEVLDIYKTKLHWGADLLRQFRAEHPNEDFPVALDTGFTSPELCEEVICSELQMDYVGSLRENQMVTDKLDGRLIRLEDLVNRLRAQQADPQQANPFQKTGFTYRGKKQYRYTYHANYRVSKYDKKQRLVISFLREDLTDRPNFTITNRLDWNPSGILRIRRHRWPVETYHQEGKVEGLESYQVRNDKAIQTYLALVTVAFSMLKYSVHDDDLLSKIQQRLQTESGITLPFLKRLLSAEGLVNLLEYVFVRINQGHSLVQIYQTFTRHIAYK